MTRLAIADWSGGDAFTPVDTVLAPLEASLQCSGAESMDVSGKGDSSTDQAAKRVRSWEKARALASALRYQEPSPG